MPSAMLVPASFRRALAFTGIVIAALASVATSESAPGVEFSGDDQLSSSAPETSHHFTVTSIGAQAVTLVIDARWSGGAGVSGASVVAIVTPDGASTGTEQQAPFADGAGDATVTVDTTGSCASNPCVRGYTVTTRLAGAGPDVQVDAQWTFDALLAGRDSSAPHSDIHGTED